MLNRNLAAFCRDQDGGITIIAAVALPVLIGMTALVAEFGHGLLTKVENQRVADLAAFAGATAYGASSSTTTMNAAIAKVAELNGYGTGAVTGSLVASPNGGGKQAVSVSVATSNFLFLAPVLRGGSTLAVQTSAAAELAAQASACIIALKAAGTGVTLSGGTSVSAPGCAVASNNTVTAPCGTSITTKNVNYNSASAPSQPCGGIVPPSGTASVTVTRVATADPLASSAGVATATGRLTSVAALTAPAAPPTTSGPNIDFGWSTNPTALNGTNCIGTFVSGTWTVTCPGSTATFGNITIGGGITLKFNVSGAPSTTYAINSIRNSGGSTMQFGPGTYNIAQGVTSEGGSTTFGAGAFNIGRSTTTACGAQFSICQPGGGVLTFAGPSTFILGGGIAVGGGAQLTFGSGTTNSFDIGAGSTGLSFSSGGGSRTVFADATGGSSVFRMTGNIDTGGGSCVTVSAAAQHDIKGFVSATGGLIFGAGAYTIGGYLALGASSGGDVTCSGEAVSLKALNATITIGAATTPSGGTCSGQAFCAAAGYQNIQVTAPASGPYQKLAVIGPISSANTSGARFAQGARGSGFSGAFYFPNGPISMSGGASIAGVSGGCLELIGSQITLQGGTAAGSTCVGGTGGAATVALIQ